ncbi:hypothetical protein C1646_753650 [Rhizophagus diaphanus]|nr:hypothetical protein C1646_753650 [Rhizophagus diaphanus] [Rhizophagus sp. MUCL 43196]
MFYTNESKGTMELNEPQGPINRNSLTNGNFPDKNNDALRAPPDDISIQDNPSQSNKDPDIKELAEHVMIEPNEQKIEADEDNEKALNLFVIASKQNYTLAKYHFKYFETVTNEDCRKTIESWLLLYQKSRHQKNKKLAVHWYNKSYVKRSMNISPIILLENNYTI